MHLQVEPNLSNGLAMMKYAVNHPTTFDDYEYAYWMGFSSHWVGVWVEIVTILYLSTLSTPIDVLTKQVCLVAVAKAGIIFAAALPKTSKLK